MKKGLVIHPDEIIINKIFIIRGKKVMIDSDLAELYEVSTKRLNEQVKRNMKRFPADFMFRLSRDEKQTLVKCRGHLNKLKYASTLPYAFTEHGAVMLASVLNSDVAIEVNVRIVRIFSRMRELVLNEKEILLQLEKLEKKVNQHDGDIMVVFRHLKELLSHSKVPMRRIGFKRHLEE